MLCGTCSNSGLDGDTFKVKWLMDKYGVQINKTSRNSVLFMTNIGTTRSSCVFLRSCIRHCAQVRSNSAAFCSSGRRC